MIPDDARLVFKGVLFDVYQWDEFLFDGSKGVFEGIKRKPSIQVLAVFQGKIVLLREEQPFVGCFVSIPGGIVESDDFLLDAKRELLEETGLSSSSFVFWKTTSFSSKVEWFTHYVFARDCFVVGEQKLDKGEKITPFFVDFDEFVERVLQEDFRNKGLSNMVLRMIRDNKLDDFKKLLLG